MSGSNITARDRVWAAIVKQEGRFQVADVREAITSDNRPSDETIRRVLRSATELHIIEHRSGSPYWHSGGSMTGHLDPKGADTEAFIDQFLDERTEDVIYSDDLTDILNDERIMKAQTKPHHYPFRPAPSGRASDRKKRVWTSAFLMQYGDADTIKIIDTSTETPVDLSEHLDMDLFEQGTDRLDLGELRETPLFDDILTELYRAHRSELDYRRIE
jgi:hypothetical protein